MRSPEYTVEAYLVKYPDNEILNAREELSDLFKSVSTSNDEKVVDWAPNILLPDGGGAGTHLDLSLTPFWVEPLKLLESRSVRSIRIVSSQRNGKSVSLLTTPVLAAAALRPRDIICLFPSQESAGRWADGDLDRILSLNGWTSRQAAGGKFRRLWANGAVTYLSWPVEQGLRGITATLAIGSEIDSWPPAPDLKATWTQLLAKRTQTAGSRSKLLLEGSPSAPVAFTELDIDTAVEELGPHEMLATVGESIAGLFNATDRAKWYWKCPHCEHEFPAAWESVFIPDEGTIHERADKACLHCQSCGAMHLDRKKLNDTGFYRSEAEVLGLETVPHADRGFWVEGVASPFVRVQDLALNYLLGLDELKKRGTDTKLRGFYNSDLGRQFVRPQEFRASVGRVKPDDNFKAFVLPSLPDGQAPETRILRWVVDQQKNWFACCLFVHDKVSRNVHLVGRQDIFDLNGKAVRPFESAEHLQDLVNHLYNMDILDEDGNEFGADHIVIDIGGGESADGSTNASRNAYAVWRGIRSKLQNESAFRMPLGLLQGARSLPSNQLFKPAKTASAAAGALVTQFCTTQTGDIIRAALSRDDGEQGRLICHSGIDQRHLDELVVEQKGQDGFYRPPTHKQRRETWDCARMMAAWMEIESRAGFDSYAEIKED